MLTRAFKGYNVPKSKGFKGKIYRDLMDIDAQGLKG